MIFPVGSYNYRQLLHSIKKAYSEYFKTDPHTGNITD